MELCFVLKFLVIETSRLDGMTRGCSSCYTACRSSCLSSYQTHWPLARRKPLRAVLTAPHPISWFLPATTQPLTITLTLSLLIFLSSKLNSLAEAVLNALHPTCQPAATQPLPISPAACYFSILFFTFFILKYHFFHIFFSKLSFLSFPSILYQKSR